MVSVQNRGKTLGWKTGEKALFSWGKRGETRPALYLEELDDMLGLNGQGLAVGQLSQGRLHHELALIIHRCHHAIQVFEVPLCDQHPVAFLEGCDICGLCAHGGHQSRDLIPGVSCFP